MELRLNHLTKETLQKVIRDMTEFLSEEQCQRLQMLVEEAGNQKSKEDYLSAQIRMPQELVDEKMAQIEQWERQIDEGELYLDTEEYEDYSSGYWDSEWVTDYYDNLGIGEKIMSIIRFAKDCVDDRRYQEAASIYEWLWEMSVCTDSEYGEPADLEVLEENQIIHTDLERLALLALYADYQSTETEKRAEELYLYFEHDTFRRLHIEDMFRAGRENLENEEQFWKDWTALLKTKNGDMEGRLLKEAVLYCDGAEGLVRMAEENAGLHPSLYLAAMNEYEKAHAYDRIEEIGKKALEKVDSSLIVRGEIALKAASASSCLQHEEDMISFCRECFRSDSTDKNYLRLFGMEKMADRQGIFGREVLKNRIRGNMECGYGMNLELRRNVIGDYGYYTLSFYTGDFETVKAASKNPKGSLGWSGSFIHHGIRLILLYLYESPLPSKAAAGLAAYVGFAEDKDDTMLDFEREIKEESREWKISVFWNYFQRWKKYFPMEQPEKRKYFSWAEKIVHSRADAIVSGQHRNQYGEAAALLTVTGEIKESMGAQGAKKDIFMEYKRKFPRHSSFQKEMKNYFG